MLQRLALPLREVIGIAKLLVRSRLIGPVRGKIVHNHLKFVIIV